MTHCYKSIPKDIITLHFNQKVILTIGYLILLYRHIHIGHESLCLHLKHARGKGEDITLSIKKKKRKQKKNPTLLK